MLRLLILCALMLLIVNGAFADVNIKVLILNDIYTQIPSKNEKMEILGRLKGDLLVMGSRYSGNIDVWRSNKGLYVINELPLEEYVKDVVISEVSPDWDVEVLKAQAVISRTYALYHKTTNGNSIYHVASSVLNQVYKGNNPDVRVSDAVEATRGEVLTFNKRLIEAFYHSTCGGMTENAEDVFGRSFPYLRPTKSDCNISPYSTWERQIELSEIEKAVNTCNLKELLVKSYTTTHRVKQIDLVTEEGVITMNATDLRKALGWSRLPSTNFSISKNGDSLIFTGKGYGHGIGLCQWCALKLAREGKNYKDILSHFYPGTTIQLYESL
ncbi:MAG: SpoIID/LytB domain-containing protein [Nitrospirota bacterium]